MQVKALMTSMNSVLYNLYLSNFKYIYPKICFPCFSGLADNLEGDDIEYKKKRKTGKFEKDHEKCGNFKKAEYLNNFIHNDLAFISWFLLLRLMSAELLQTLSHYFELRTLGFACSFKHIKRNT